MTIRLRQIRKRGFTSQPNTLCQHLRSRRLILKLTQEEVAEHLDTVREHYERWERDRVSPTASFWPRLISFLGYYPFDDDSPSGMMHKARRMLGLSQFAFGRKIGATAKNVREWEHGQK
jgi:DNA-binding transcriptional regulator YiaG